jgi:transposase
MDTAERNARIIASVKAGATFREAAQAHGVTKNTVAGLWHRSGLAIPPDDLAARRSRTARNRIRTPEGEAKRIAAMRAYWAAKRKERNAERPVTAP